MSDTRQEDLPADTAVVESPVENFMRAFNQQTSQDFMSSLNDKVKLEIVRQQMAWLTENISIIMLILESNPMAKKAFAEARARIAAAKTQAQGSM